MGILWELYKEKDFDVKPTLERIKKACEYIGNPQKNYPSILVGGTNGKGSTCAFTERILREHGFKTGWFVSPHLISENERWRINGKPIQEEVLKDYVKDLKKVFEKFSLTYFEAATLIAVKYFEDQGINVAVFEVGMGGRWDATKVSEAGVRGITNVERDHTRWLGDTVEKIAEEKLGLYEEGKPLILGSARYPLYTRALELGLKNLKVAGIDYEYWGKVERERTVLEKYESENFSLEGAQLSLWGKWQIDNASLAITLSSEFTKLSPEKVNQALKNTVWEGRMEVLREKPLLMVDASHNPYSVVKVVKTVKKHFPEVKVAYSSLKGKEWELTLTLLRNLTEEIYLLPIDYYRAEDVKNLEKFAKEMGFKTKVFTIEELLNLEEDMLIIGSIYLIGEVKKYSQKIKQEFIF
ncbi:folylpolyglutamate synthase/dihydrofolate synthase family protein [Aquifex aeolicus]|uniref:tetrahydrofolate synthase n=1 Tax=Aquifex aeolicus (strain VF5) TaxID=224324 RepID=O67833_AQUAE|nr:folylpolyglutamate synthase/dihydrofolate synthase family protein [Aquifex aeolicus]AAC07789.1 folylpolyglutamate synthetase [Aquifex aeolicus VF5]